MRLARFLSAAGLGLLTATGAARAQEQEHSVEEVVVTSGALAVSLDSATTHVEIVGRGELDLAPPAGLGDTLNGLPGLRSTAFGPGSSRPVIRGLSGPRVLILQNGVGMVDASSLSPDHAVASDPGEATRIEVLRGPSTLAYGGSGIGGVVNVIDERVPTRAAPTGLEGRLAASYGTVDENRAVSGGLKAGKGPWVFAADASTRRSGDYRVPSAPVSDVLAARDGLTPLDDRRVLNSAVALDAYGAGLSFVHEDGFFGASVKRTETEYGVPYLQAIPAGPPAPDAEGPVGIRLRQTRIDLRGEQRLDGGPFSRARLSVGHADYRHNEIEQATGEVGTTFLSDGTEGRLELVQRQIGAWQGAVGAQGLSRKLEAIGDEAFIPAVSIAEAGVFTLQRYDRDHWGLEGGLRLDRRRLRTATDRRAFTNLSASAGAFFKPSEPMFLGLSVSRNRRAPTEVELFADGPHPGTGAYELGDAGLRPETVNSAELTARYAVPKFHVEGHVYAARYQDFIDERPTGAVEDGLPVFRYLQTDARFVGLEAEIGYHLWDEGPRSLAVEATMDWVRGSTDAGRPARIPPAAVTTRLIYEGEVFGVTAEARRVARQERTAAFETPTAAYTLLNLTASVKPWPDRAVRLFAEGRNLGDIEAREHVSFLKDIAPLPGRSFRVGVSAQF